MNMTVAVAVGGDATVAELVNFKIEDFYLCEEVVEHKLKFFVHPKDFNAGSQLVDMNMTLPVAIDNGATAKLLLELNTQATNNHSWMYLFSAEDGACRIIDTYLGELWYRIETGLGIMARSCPIPRGNYHAVNFNMDYRKVKIQAVPFGKVRLTITVFVKKHPDIIGCVKIVCSNRAN